MARITVIVLIVFKLILFLFDQLQHCVRHYHVHLDFLLSPCSCYDDRYLALNLDLA